MLPAHIIDQIRQREKKEQSRYQQPSKVLELPRPLSLPLTAVENVEEKDRGVVILDLDIG